MMLLVSFVMRVAKLGKQQVGLAGTNACSGICLFWGPRCTHAPP
jgi:hypothetical protein